MRERYLKKEKVKKRGKQWTNIAQKAIKYGLVFLVWSFNRSAGRAVVVISHVGISHSERSQNYGTATRLCSSVSERSPLVTARHPDAWSE